MPSGFAPWLAAPRGGTTFWIQGVTVAAAGTYTPQGSATILSGTILDWRMRDNPQMRAIQPMDSGETNNLQLRSDKAIDVTGLFLDLSVASGSTFITNGSPGTDGASALLRLYYAYKTFEITRNVGGDRVVGIFEGAGYEEAIDGEGTATFRMTLMQRGNLTATNVVASVGGATSSPGT